jgi:16S rRNA (cytidine1402-2'-O)-methyltransferase
MAGNLYLVPNSLGSTDTDDYLPANFKPLITGIRYFVVENVRNARRYLKLIDQRIDIDAITFFELNKHTDAASVPAYLQPATEGHHIGMISEAGLPGIADPGALLVSLAHQKQIRVVPVTGPSSMFLALMGSGFNGQQFRFSGYLPVQKNERIQAIRQLEHLVESRNETQLFMETPYRNNALLSDLCNTCKAQTMLCVAADLTMDTEMIRTAPVGWWKKKKPDLHKRPAVFLLGNT